MSLQLLLLLLQFSCWYDFIIQGSSQRKIGDYENLFTLCFSFSDLTYFVVVDFWWFLVVVVVVGGGGGGAPRKNERKESKYRYV